MEQQRNGEEEDDEDVLRQRRHVGNFVRHGKHGRSFIRPDGVDLCPVDKALVEVPCALVREMPVADHGVFVVFGRPPHDGGLRVVEASLNQFCRCPGVGCFWYRWRLD